MSKKKLKLSSINKGLAIFASAAIVVSAVAIAVAIGSKNGGGEITNPSEELTSESLSLETETPTSESEEISFDNISEEINSEEETVNSYVLSAGDIEVGQHSTDLNVDVFTIHATESKYVNVETGSWTYGEEEFNARLKMSGKGTAEYRSIEFTINQEKTIEIYYQSGGSDARTLTVFDSNLTEVHSFTSTASSEVNFDSTTLAAGKYYLYGSDAALNIFKISLITPKDMTPYLSYSYTSSGETFVVENETFYSRNYAIIGGYDTSGSTHVYYRFDSVLSAGDIVENLYVTVDDVIYGSDDVNTSSSNSEFLNNSDLTNELVNFIFVDSQDSVASLFLAWTNQKMVFLYGNPLYK